MQTFKLKKHIIIFLIWVIVLNALLTFVIEPNTSSSSAMWTGFYACEKIDTIYVGTSHCLSGIRPDVIDEITGYKSYNMATNLQSLDSSLAAIKAAYEKYNIKRVIIAIDTEDLGDANEDDLRPKATFIRTKLKHESIGSKINESIKFITDPDIIGKSISINYFFPWTYNREMNVIANIKSKLSGEIENTRDEFGFEPSDEIIQSERESYIDVDSAIEWNMEAEALNDVYISDNNKEGLIKILGYCKQNDIEVIGINIPYLTYLTVNSYDSYRDLNNEISGLFSEYSYLYYDFNLINEKYYSYDINEFKDTGHMNTAGATSFSKFFGEFVSDTGLYEGYNDLFYELK